MSDWQAGGFGLYLHWPFCQAKCPYCDFNSHVSNSIDHARWLRAYLSEIDRVAAQTPGRSLRSIFFGGGTPSLMLPETVGAIIERIKSHWPVANNIEITLEANPTSVEADRFRGFHDAGVNRVSMGIQALNDDDLRRLGRLHSVAEARVAFDIARDVFERVSFDLIYARQDQTLNDWRAELRVALAMAADHLSLYQLTIEPGTAFGDRHARGGLRGLPDDELGADLYDLTQDLCGAAGLPAYEVSNHAADMAQSQHNLIYWRGGDYVGIGPGAHGRLTLDGTRWATETPLRPNVWLDAVDQTGTGENARTALSAADQADELLLMGLRISEGIDLYRYAKLNGSPLNEAPLAEMLDLGFVEREGAQLRLTPKGRPVLNAVLRALSPDR